jgi:large subunit ribosomal protein L25
MTEVEVRCLPKDLPEFIEVDLSKLELNQAVHLSELKLKSGVTIVALMQGEDKPVATIYIPRAIEIPEEKPVAPVTEEGGEAAAAAAPGAEAGKEKESGAGKKESTSAKKEGSGGGKKEGK